MKWITYTTGRADQSVCDWPGRDLQFAEMGTLLGPAKGKDTASTIGPMLVTADELADHKSGKGFDLMMRAWVNDEFRGWLQSGDRVRMSVDVLGTLVMTVGDQLPLHPTQASTTTRTT